MLLSLHMKAKKKEKIKENFIDKVCKNSSTKIFTGKKIKKVYTQYRCVCVCVQS